MLGLSLLLYLIANVAFGQTQFAGSSCNEGLGMQNYWIQNADITASSIRDFFHDPGKARLHGNSAWMPSAQNEEQFLQIYFKGGTNVSAVAFQGHPNYEYWVTRYKLLFSLDGKTWEELSEVFTLVRDNKDEVITSQLPELKNVRFVRVYPTEWYGAIAIRMEIYGCMKEFANCGNRVLTNHHSRQKRIVGGKVAEPNSWPWQVEIIENGTKHFCGGSIIHPQWILTAGHCADPFYSTTVKEIRLGEHNRVKLEGYEEIMEGNRYYIHPGFKIDRPTAESPGDYDVALYHLKRPATFYSKVSPVCLPDEDSTVPEDIGRMCFVTGWGHSMENGTYSEVLQENQVPIVSRQECNKEESYNGKVHERYLCAGYQEGGMDACQGDSGGPLVCQDSAGKWVLAGVVTWGEGCARPHKYGVYADVRRFLPFIESTIYGYPKCGIRPVQSQISRIIGGREARPNSWPWQVDLLVNGTAHLCGGSLIGSSWVVTSGHCFFLYDKPSQWQIRVGEHNESKFEGYEEKIDIANITIHPGFQLGSKNYTGDYDIAIIKLKRPAVFHKRVHSICLPDMETSFSAGKTCFATGWGKQQENASAYSEVLREVEVNLVSKEVCNSNISYRGGINERYFCAGFPEGGKDACYGDSGGPLACQKEDGSFVLTGVVSWGTGCARANKYGVYLDVRYMLPFIENTLYGHPSCGIRPVQSQISRIIGGHEARPNSWPWQVDLLVNGTAHGCGGSLIGSSWVVTSGHCFFFYDKPSQWQIRVGEHNESKFEGYEEKIDIENITIHPGFQLGSKNYTGDYDIAIIKLKRPAVFHKRVHSICLPDMKTSFSAGKTCFATGWGKQQENASAYSEVLREVEVNLVSKEVCNSNISYRGGINERYFCAGFPEGGKDACYGDSGGPLACQKEDGSFVLTGVVSWGTGCARANKYGVYLDVRYMLPFIENTLYGHPSCGIRPVQSQISRIIGGREARPNSWPWQVDLLVNGTAHGCGGSLIGSSWVVTSGHCFFLYDKPSQWQIRVGEHNESKFEGYEEKIDIENITIHPGFQLGNENYTGDYDIAIIKLKRPAVFHKRVHSICLPDMKTSFSAGKTCFATGWGKQQENASAYSEVLREVEVNLVSKEVCNSNISYRGGINERYFCAGFPEGGKDACYGDSGGPLACQKEDGSFVLTGVVSWGTGCARANKYGVYLDVRYMLPFIESVITGFRPECGTRFIPASSSLMVSGHDARPNSWPWQVELLFLNTHACSGTLIDGLWILTSADCVNARGKPENWTARVGEHDRTVLEGYEEIIGVKNIVVSLKRHIALMKLERMAVLHRRVSPICLPNEGTEFANGSLCYVIGWRSFDKQGNTSNILKEAQVKLDSTKLCNSSFNGTISKYERCASSVRNEDQICNVDGGAPLVCPRDDGKFVLAGVANSGDWCSNPGQHGVFTDVKSMLSFIHNTVTVAADISA